MSTANRTVLDKYNQQDRGNMEIDGQNNGKVIRTNGDDLQTKTRHRDRKDTKSQRDPNNNTKDDASIHRTRAKHGRRCGLRGKSKRNHRGKEKKKNQKTRNPQAQRSRPPTPTVSLNNNEEEDETNISSNNSNGEDDGPSHNRRITRARSALKR